MLSSLRPLTFMTLILYFVTSYLIPVRNLTIFFTISEISWRSPNTSSKLLNKKGNSWKAQTFQQDGNDTQYEFSINAVINRNVCAISFQRFFFSLAWNQQCLHTVEGCTAFHSDRTENLTLKLYSCSRLCAPKTGKGSLQARKEKKDENKKRIYRGMGRSGVAHFGVVDLTWSIRYWNFSAER